VAELENTSFFSFLVNVTTKKYILYADENGNREKMATVGRKERAKSLTNGTFLFFACLF
jgi:hypothetical protein